MTRFAATDAGLVDEDQDIVRSPSGHHQQNRAAMPAGLAPPHRLQLAASTTA
jgi:hypothetical protein